MTDLDAATFEGVAFLGNTLAPFFLQDPRTGDAGAEFAAVAVLDAQAAGAEWPFVGEEEAARCLAMMVEGLAPSCAAEESGAFAADDDLTWEYRRLFIGPGAKPAPPWGSVYTDRECVVFGATPLNCAHGCVNTALREPLTRKRRRIISGSCLPLWRGLRRISPPTWASS